MTLRRSHIAEPRILSRRYDDCDGVACGVKTWDPTSPADSVCWLNACISCGSRSDHCPNGCILNSHGRARYDQYLSELREDWNAPVLLVFCNPHFARRAEDIKAAALALQAVNLTLSPVKQAGVRRLLYIVHTRAVTQEAYESLCRACYHSGQSMPVVMVGRVLQLADVASRKDPISLLEYAERETMAKHHGESNDGGIDELIDSMSPIYGISPTYVSSREYRSTDWAVVKSELRGGAMALNRSKPQAVKVAGKRGRQSIPDMLQAIAAKTVVEKVFDNEPGAVSAMKRYSKICTEEKLAGFTFGPSILPDEVEEIDAEGNVTMVPTGKYGFLISRS